MRYLWKQCKYPTDITTKERLKQDVYNMANKIFGNYEVVEEHQAIEHDKFIYKIVIELEG